MSVKKFLNTLLLTQVAACLCVANVSAAGTLGFRTKDDYVVISDADGLMEFASQVNAGNTFADKKVILINDIDLNGYEWVQIGNGSRTDASTPNFAGTFDGHMHKVKNLVIEGDEADNCYGLFGVVSNAVVKNVVVESGKIINTNGSAGAVVGCAIGDESKIENNTAGDGVVVSGNTSGGVIGRSYASKNYLYNNKNYAKVECSSKCGGISGIIGTTSDSAMIKNENYGLINGGNAGVGGIVGYANANSVIGLNTNYGNVKSTKYSGGIVGYATGGNGFVVDNENRADIDGANAVGGIIGSITASYSVENSKNYGKITSSLSTESAAGGIVGDVANGYVSNTQNFGEVSGGKYAGGVVGKTGKQSVIKYNNGGKTAVNGNVHSGRLVGAVASADVSIYISDNNGDDYTNLDAINIVGPLTAISSVYIEDGNLISTPESYPRTKAKIVFKEGTKWDGVEQGNVFYEIQGTSDVLSETWKKTEITDIVTNTDPTYTAAGKRTYYYLDSKGQSKNFVAAPAMKKVDVNNAVESKDGKNSVVTYTGTNGFSKKYTMEPVLVAVVFNDEDGQIANITEMDNGDKAVEIEEPTKEGYSFIGWFVKGEDKQVYDFAEAVKEDKELYAKWVKDEVVPMVPDTFDGINMPVILAIVSVSGLIGTNVIRKKMHA